MEAAKELASDKQKQLIFRKAFNRVKLKIGKINKQIRATWVSPSTSAGDKSKKIDKLLEQRNKLIQQAYKLYMGEK